LAPARPQVLGLTVELPAPALEQLVAAFAGAVLRRAPFSAQRGLDAAQAARLEALARTLQQAWPGLRPCSKRHVWCNWAQYVPWAHWMRRLLDERSGSQREVAA
jgi:hypothetical protein